MREIGLRYFAWVRERVGIGEERRELPEDVSDAAALIAWLAGQGEQYEAAFGQPKALRVAYDMRQVEMDTPLDGVREVAIYPPMTGG